MNEAERDIRKLNSYLRFFRNNTTCCLLFKSNYFAACFNILSYLKLTAVDFELIEYIVLFHFLHRTSEEIQIQKLEHVRITFSTGKSYTVCYMKRAYVL